MRRASFRGALVALSLLSVLPRCAKEPTSLFVRVSADSSLRSTWQNVQGVTATATVRVYDADASADGPQLDAKVIQLGGFQTETTFLVEARGAAAKVRIDVEAQVSVPRLLPMPERFTMTNRAIVTYTEDRVLDVSIVFYGACRTQTACTTSQRCDMAGGCVMATVTGTPHAS